jgi:SulP family sulfate permease
VVHAPTPVRCFIVDAGSVTDIDYSAAQSLSDMDRHGVTAAIGEGRISPTLHEAIAAAHVADKG